MVAAEALAHGVGQFRQVRGGGGQKLGVDHQGQQVRVGEVAVIVGLLLGAHGAGLVPLGVVEAGLLDHLAAALDDVDLALDLETQGALQEAEGVDVLDLGAGAELFLALGADGDIGVHAEGTLLHVAVADADPAHDLVDLAGVGHRLLRRAQVRLGDDLQQGGAGAVEVDAGEAVEVLMQGLAGVLLQMGAGDADLLAAAVLELDAHLAPPHHRMFVLADLVALGQVGVEVVLAGEDRARGDLGVNGRAEAHRQPHRRLVEDRQHPRQAQVDGAGLGVGCGAEGGGGAGEDLGLGGELGVDLQPDDGFPWHGGVDLVCGLGGLWAGRGSWASREASRESSRYPGGHGRSWPVLPGTPTNR